MNLMVVGASYFFFALSRLNSSSVSALENYDRFSQLSDDDLPAGTLDSATICVALCRNSETVTNFKLTMSTPFQHDRQYYRHYFSYCQE